MRKTGGRGKPERQPIVIIRKETASDVDAITDVTLAAFKTLEVSNQTEHFIVKALRAAGALSISLVAEIDGRVVGHVAFSPISISDGTTDWYGLGPVSVLPELHKQGIGKALIHEGLALLKAIGASGCALVGDPGYYERFGFKSVHGLQYEGVPPEFFLVLPFTDIHPEGTVTFHEAFQATS